MTAELPNPLCCDPIPPEWPTIELPETWESDLRFTNPRALWRFIRAIAGPRKPVSVDSKHPLFRHIPRYALQEFHSLPNGNYSSKISRGYITGFDRAMLGIMNDIRSQMAEWVSDCQAVLDVGTGGGKLAASVRKAGPEDVWGVDVSPYLLKHAAELNPDIRFIPAAAEKLPFDDRRFDAVVVSFLFHEIPPKHIHRALAEIARVLRPGGRLLIAEPSEKQLQPVRLRSLLHVKGWRHLYFKILAERIFEPFLMAWHRLDKTAAFDNAGFELDRQYHQIPISLYSLTKRAPREV